MKLIIILSITLSQPYAQLNHLLRGSKGKDLEMMITEAKRETEVLQKGEGNGHFG